MITVVFKNIVKDNEIVLKDRNTIYLEISGHSFLNTKGNDILCSAVSTLTQTFIITVSRILKIKQKIGRDEGFLSSLITLDGVSAEDRSKIELLIDSLLIGLNEINSEYPDKIKFEFVND